MVKEFSNQFLNVDLHPSQAGERDIFFLKNGDIQGFESGSQSYFVQNKLGNTPCVIFPDKYIERGFIPINDNKVVVFLHNSTDNLSQIGVINLSNCTYEIIVTDACLNFVSEITGVYKFTNKEGRVRVYWVDGVNSNRYLDIYRDGAFYHFPKKLIGSNCESCTSSETNDLDCEKLSITANIKVPCLKVVQNNSGNLESGVYQIGLAYGDDNLILSNYYLSQPIHLFGNNLSLDVEIECVDNIFSELTPVIVSQTRTNGLVAYKFPSLPVTATKFTLSNLDNASIVSTEEILTKKVYYDKSKFIVTNSETLLLGGHGSNKPLNYQTKSNNITVNWQEIKVLKSKAHLYPSFMRDEVYALAIEWFDLKGNSLGVFHIPGRLANLQDIATIPPDNDIYELENCNAPVLVKWQVENTASGQSVSPPVLCQECGGRDISKYGDMSYWETENLRYPNTSEFGSLACQPIRHHKMPSSTLTHIHNDFIAQSIPQDCYDIDLPEGGTYEYCPPNLEVITEDNCINILAVSLGNIQHPTDEFGNEIPVLGYRILVGDRKSHKSILHKGLIYNMWEDTSTKDKSFYPNYPFNDLNADVFLNTSQYPNNNIGQSPNSWFPPNVYSRRKFTYHSPEIHYTETANEFGTELKLYGEEVGYINGTKTDVYKHPKTRLGKGNIQDLSYSNNVKQLNGVCNYARFLPYTVAYKSRFKVESSQFLLPVKQITSDGTRVNNYLRESSFYVSLNRDVPNPATEDVSRILSAEGNKSYSWFTNISRVGSNVKGVSYYTGVKIKQPDQYGSLEQISYRPVTCIQTVIPDDSPNYYGVSRVFGGDVYISRHTLLRKMPLFTQWLTDVPITTEINYKDYNNVWFPRFYYNNLTTVDDEYNVDGQLDITGGNTDTYLAAGDKYLFITGVINFWCESEYIGNYREEDISINGQFYPKISFEDVSRADKIPFDNKYIYNLFLLNNNVERVYQNTDKTIVDNNFIVSTSQKETLQSTGDPWLQFLPLNYSKLPKIYGNFTGMHFVDMYSIFFIFENQILYSRVDYSLNLNEGGVLRLGQGDIFTNRLQKLSNEDSGYVGSIDLKSFVNTRYGTYFIDRLRKRLFKWNGSLQDVTGNMYSWFQEFLKAGNQSIKAIFDNYSEQIYFSNLNVNPWTLSYYPKFEGMAVSPFVSFHSFYPSFLLADKNTFFSVNNSGKGKLWKHNSKGVYQTYYGVKVPFEIGFIINESFQNVDLQALQVYCEYIKRIGFNSLVTNKDKFFNKVLVYNDKVNTGVRNVVVKNKENPSQSLLQAENVILNPITEVTNVNNTFRFNKLESVVKSPDLPTLTWFADSYQVNNVDFSINPIDREELKGNWFKVHLIDDVNVDHKILLKLLLSKNDKLTK